ncbi:probable ATP-dependent RNA helicase DDX52 [Daphnia pulex]|uniref:probable ATP-dependent RNA helicase DDX52 n=1 Tax=Daphnia pulex TaxID=6669 RepID=UPI001EDF81E2|nr:probable ATP-dependent RNA helicase DDX52 [Daphnia pulex]
MDARDLFRRLSAGAKFDKNRFKNDAIKFQLAQKQPSSTSLSNSTLGIDTTQAQHNHQPENDIDNNSCEENEENETVENIVDPRAEIKALRRERKRKIKTPKELAALKKEEISRKRKAHKIHVQGSDIPTPVETFEELAQQFSIKEELIKNIQTRGYEVPTPIQMQAIPLMLKKREILACAPTGSGKTAAFLVPIIHCLGAPQKKGFRAVIVSPTRELANQTHRECVKLTEGIGLRCHVIDNVGKATQKFGPKSSQRFDILITTPNRLVFLLSQEPPAISLKNVEWLIVDESDKLFEEGRQGFRDQLGAIYRACDSNQIRRAFFSATFAFDVQEWCKLNLDNVVMLTIGQKNSASEKVEQQLIFAGSEGGKLMAFRNLIVEGLNPPVLVFVQTKERAKELYTELVYDGINVDVIHAERSQLQRDNVVKSFRSGQIWVLICTELMGRGIDFKGVNLVVNYDFPPSAISYIHRIGRTGRAGRPGKAITFFTECDAVYLRKIATVMRNSGCEVPEYMLQMKKTSRSDAKKMARKVPTRKSISTEPLPDKIKRKKRERIIANVRKNKQNGQQGPSTKKQKIVANNV